jgi:hypothetical protein
MEWNEIKMRLRDGASVQILADLEGVPYKTMYNRIKQHELKDGKTYMNASALKVRGGRRTTKKPDEKKVAYKKPEVIEAPKQKIECREVDPVKVVHPSPEAKEAMWKMEEKIQEASEKLKAACQKVSEKLREAIPTPEVTIQVVEDAEKGPEEEGGSPEEKWQNQKLSGVADKIIDELDQRIDLLNDELQRIEDKKIELLYEVGIWKNIMNALQRERGIK